MTRTDPTRVNLGRRYVMAERRAQHVPYAVPDRPHQGKREVERVRRQAARVRARRLVRQLVTAHKPLPDELLVDANVKQPAEYRRADMNGDFWLFAP